jgi:NDP-sugar pyrophosphorylase family protein
VIGDDSAIGKDCEISNTIIAGNVRVGNACRFSDSVLGENIDIGSGTTVSSRNRGKGNVMTLVKGELKDTERQRFGTVIADNVKVGASSTLCPGVKIWPGRKTKPGETVCRDIQ